MARQVRQVQLEQSDIHLALNMANMTIARFLHATIKESQYLIKNPYAKLQDVKKLGVMHAAIRS